MNKIWVKESGGVDGKALGIHATTCALTNACGSCLPGCSSRSYSVCGENLDKSGRGGAPNFDLVVNLRLAVAAWP